MVQEVKLIIDTKMTGGEGVWPKMTYDNEKERGKKFPSDQKIGSAVGLLLAK